jgi:hypothetical protein
MIIQSSLHDCRLAHYLNRTVQYEGIDDEFVHRSNQDYKNWLKILNEDVKLLLLSLAVPVLKQVPTHEDVTCT